MNKTSSVYTRVSPQVKEQAEEILDELGIPMSNAIALFLKQVVLQRGIPFDLKLPQSKPVEYANLTEEQFNARIEEGLMEQENGNFVSANVVRRQLSKEFNL